MSKVNTTNPINKYMAKTLLQLRSETAVISFFNTVWNGSFIMLTWNPLQGEIIGNYDLSNADLIDLRDIIINYYDTQDDYDY